MAKRQVDRPMYRIQMALASVRLAVEHPQVHDEAKLREIMIEADYAIRMLMDFRNIVNGMVGFEEEPSQSVAIYAESEE